MWCFHLLQHLRLPDLSNYLPILGCIPVHDTYVVIPVSGHLGHGIYVGASRSWQTNKQIDIKSVNLKTAAI